MVTCKNCETVFDEKFVICPKCGTVYEDDVPGAADTSATVRQAAQPETVDIKVSDIQKQPAEQDEADAHISDVKEQFVSEKTERKKSKGKLIAIIAVVCAVLVGAAAAVFIIMSQNNDNGLSEQISLGEKYLSEENYDDAIDAFKKAIELEPNNSELYKKLADSYIGKGDIDGAIQALEEGYSKTKNESLKMRADVLKNDKKYDELMENGQKLLDEKKYTEAVSSFEQAAEIKVKEEKPYLSAADGYIGNENYSGAKTILEKGYNETDSSQIKKRLDAVEEEIKYIELIENGQRLLDDTYYSDAADSFEQAAEIKVKEEKPYLSAADSYIKCEDLDNAKAILEKGYKETKSEQVKKKLDEVTEEINKPKDYSSFVSAERVRAKKWLSNDKYEYVYADMPQLDIPGLDEQDSINEQIMELYKKDPDRDEFFVSGQEYHVYSYKNIMSLVVLTAGNNNYRNYYIYNINMKDKTIAGNDDIFEAIGVTEKDFNDNLEKNVTRVFIKENSKSLDNSGIVISEGDTMDDVYKALNKNDNSFTREEIEKQLSITLEGTESFIPNSADNKKYIDENGKLHIMIHTRIFFAAGEGGRMVEYEF